MKFRQPAPLFRAHLGDRARGLTVVAALLANGLAVAAQPLTYKLHATICPGGVCVGQSPDEACAQYANERIRYSQSNPRDHNKWVTYENLSTDVTGEPDGQHCASGQCHVTLRAQNGFKEGANPLITACVDVEDDDKTKDEDSCKSNPPYGNPIFPLEGRKRESVAIDLGLDGLPGAITYDTGRRLPTSSDVVVPSPDAKLASFGDLWHGAWHKRIVAAADLKSAQVSRGDGRFISFVGDGAGSFTATASDTDVRLSLDGDQFRYKDLKRGIVESYSRAGSLVRIDTVYGLSFSFSYSDATIASNVAPGSGYLTRVTDTFGRQIAFLYNVDGTIRLIRGPGLPAEHDNDDLADGSDDPKYQEVLPAIKASYTNGNLTGLTWQDGKSKTFAYTKPGIPWALTRIVDEELQAYATFGYDNFGRAVSTEHGIGKDRYSVTYAAPPTIVVSDTYDAGQKLIRRTRRWQLPAQPLVATPAGGSVVLGADLVADHPKVSTRSQPAGSGCGVSESKLSYDDRGNVTSQVDFNKVRSCYAYASGRHVETYRLEGLGESATCPADLAAAQVDPDKAQRKISTRWHALWALERQRAEPKLITTTVYNGGPDPITNEASVTCAPGAQPLPGGDPIAVVCRRYQQATEDETGNQGFDAKVIKTRKWTYEYNEFGQLTKETDPRGQASGKSTTYAYWQETAFTGAGAAARGHWKGDLKSATNAQNQTASHLEYNQRGQVLTTKLPNGTQELREYHPRGWLSKVTQVPSDDKASQVTQYEYWNNGLLRKVTQPDGAFAEFKWDVAHRLESVTDSVGNKVRYEMDDAGNRLFDRHEDANGNLAKLISRTFDALGRMQSMSGVQ